MPEILLLAEPEVAEQVAALLPGATVCTSLELARRRVRSDIGVLVLAVPRCATAFAGQAIRWAGDLAMAESAIVVTSFSHGNVRDLIRLWHGNVVWLEVVDVELPEAVERVLSRDLRKRAYDLFVAQAAQGDLRLRGGFRKAFLDEVPPLNHSELASASGVGEGDFRRRWKAAGLPGRSESLVDWALLVRATHKRSLGESLNRCAYGWGSEPRRIQRAAYRRVGRAAGRLNGDAVWDALVRWLTVG